MGWFDNYPLTDEQIEDIRQAIAEADAGLFASEEEVEAMFRRILGPANARNTSDGTGQQP